MRISNIIIEAKRAPLTWVSPARVRAGHAGINASALLLVLWAVTMMSMTILGVVEYVRYDLEETASMEKDFRARQLAESGIAIGLHPIVRRGDSVLMQTIAPGESFEVHLRSEGSRLNINSILQTQQWQVLHDLFVVWGLAEFDAGKAAQSFKEWATSPLSKAQGQSTVQLQLPPQSQNPQNPNRPQNPNQPPVQVAVRLFDSVDQMLLVPGMDAVAAAKPDWRDYFTIWSDGRLDMNEAPADLIAAVCGIGMGRAQQFVNTRLGPDGKLDTDDDMIFDNLDLVRQMLGISKDDFAKIQNQLSLQDSVTRIESTGTLGTYQRKIMVVARRNSTPPTYLQWQE